MAYLATNVFPGDGTKTFWDFSFAGVNPDAESGTTPYLYAEDVKALELYKDIEGNAASAVRIVTIDPAMPTRAHIAGAPVAAGRQIKIFRQTEIRYPLVDYRDRQAVSEADLDLANRQAIFVAQETQDVASNNMTLDKNDNYDVLDRRIVNLAPAVDDTDAVNLAQLKTSIRVPAVDGPVAELPLAAARANRLLSFDSLGNPVVTLPPAGSATDLEMRLSMPDGAAIVGDGAGTVQSHLSALDSEVSAVAAVAAATAEDVVTLATPAGAGMVGWERQALTTAIDAAGKMLDAQSVNIWEFANFVTNKPTPGDPGTWDWTPAVVAANASVTQPGIYPSVGDLHVLFPVGRYCFSAVEFGQRVHVTCAGAVFAPFDVLSTQTHLIKFLGHNICRNIVIDMDYAMDYGTAIWMRGRYSDFFGTVIWKCRVGWTIGDPAWEDDPDSGHLGDSEINICGGATVWAITAIRIYGQNTIVHVTGGYRVYSFKNSLTVGDPRKAAWDALVENTVINCGGLLYITGSGMANFSGTNALILSKLQVVNSVANPAYKNSFGRTYLSGVHLETGKILQCADVPVGATADDNISVLFEAVNCNGYLTTAVGNTFEIKADCQQAVHVSGCGFYGVTNNNLINAVAAPVHIDEFSFSNRTIEFFQTLRIKIPRGYANFNALNATSTAQAFTPTYSALVMPTRDVSDVFTGNETQWYSTTTGAFTPRSDMRNVKLDLSLLMTGGQAADVTTVQLMVAGVQVDIASLYGANPRVTLRARRILAGQSVSINVQSSASRVASGSSSNRLLIVGAV